MQETWVRSMDWENPLEEGMATHSDILAQRISMDRGTSWVTVHRVTKSWKQLKQLSMHVAKGKALREDNIGAMEE